MFPTLFQSSATHTALWIKVTLWSTFGILLTAQVVLSTDAWVWTYAKMIIPDVMKDPAGLRTPAAFEVRDNYIFWPQASDPPAPV